MKKFAFINIPSQELERPPAAGHGGPSASRRGPGPCRRRGSRRPAWQARVPRAVRPAGLADTGADDGAVAVSHLFDDEGRHGGRRDDAQGRRPAPTR